MKYNVIKLYNEILTVEKELNQLVENDAEYEKLYQQSILTDGIIAKYLTAQKNLEQERRNLLKKYDTLLNSSFKTEIIDQIKKDILIDFPDVLEEELNHFSNNVYVYTTLLAHQIDEHEIIEQLIFLNNRYFEQMSKNNKLNENIISTENIKYLNNLKNKYIQIIKQKI